MSLKNLSGLFVLQRRFMFNKKEFENKIIERISDPATGETIHRAAIAPELIETVKKKIAGHSGTMQQFVSQSQNYFLILQSQMQLLDKIKKADEEVKDALGDVIKKSKLDPKLPWCWNMVLGSMEYRTPPIMPGMTDAEIRSSQHPGLAPEIKQNPSMGVK